MFVSVLFFVLLVLSVYHTLFGYDAMFPTQVFLMIGDYSHKRALHNSLDDGPGTYVDIFEMAESLLKFTYTSPHFQCLQFRKCPGLRCLSTVVGHMLPKHGSCKNSHGYQRSFKQSQRGLFGTSMFCDLYFLNDCIAFAQIGLL